MAEVNWEERYVSYVEGDLRRDIQELKDGQKALDGKVGRVEENLRQDIRDLDAKMDKKFDRMFYVFGGALIVALIGGLVNLFVK